MQRLFIVNRYFFAGINVAQSKENYVAIDRADVGVWFAGVIDVMRAVATAAAIDAPGAVNVADAQLGAMSASLCFAIRNALASVLGDLAALRKEDRGKAALAIDG